MPQGTGARVVINLSLTQTNEARRVDRLVGRMSVAFLAVIAITLVAEHFGIHSFLQ